MSTLFSDVASQSLTLSWLTDTLIWTGALIALVLILRRPVARHFGPTLAYALWLLPAVRLLLPPIKLPAWLAPQEAAGPAINPMPETAAGLAVASEGAAAGGMTTQNLIEPAVAFISQPAAAQSPWSVMQMVLFVWLVGACSFLFLRFRGYFDMRRTMLSEAREVGRAGKVRLIETPATSAPLAFGVLDKVVALPKGFMALPDREARDLAVEHELAHHRGHDLLANILVQPLFALHWFNPLGHLGWLALRRDQEAACDARVMAQTADETRAIYANVIASFAAGPHVGLAAPMACPVLGDKSIIHRLRSLQMKDMSPRRRMAGRSIVAIAALAVPLTASVTYAEDIAASMPAKVVNVEAPVAPAPPTPPALGDVLVPDAPLAPSAPSAPLPGLFQAASDVGTDEIRTETVSKDGTKKVTRKYHIHRSGDAVHTGANPKVKVIKRSGKSADGSPLTEKQIEEIMVEVREGLAEADFAIAEAHAELAELEHEGVDGERTVVEMKCDGPEAASNTVRKDGTNVVRICRTKILAHALSGLKQARDQIANDTELSDTMRKNILTELDQRIEGWAEKEG